MRKYGAPHFGFVDDMRTCYSGFESTTRAQPLARKIVASYIEQGIDYMNYSPNRESFRMFPGIHQVDDGAKNGHF